MRERSNSTTREIPATCPKEIRAKIQAKREQRDAPAPAPADPEGWELLKKFASGISEQ
jgi:hypothetical protein